MIKYFILLPAILFSYLPLRAQNHHAITGTVVELESREPLQYANIVLSKEIDSSFVTGTVTNAEGTFRLENIDKGKYYLTISFMGFEKNQTSVFNHQSSTYIGTIPLKKSAIFLDQVDVTAEKSTLISSLDKKIYNVGKDIISESSSVSEILQNIPSVSVDINGKVTLRGTSNITFLINGKPSSLLRRNAAAALQQIPAYTIERIEVITNPSAKYNPEGMGGIINIIKKKESEKGINGQIIENIGNEKRFNSNLLFNYSHQNISTYLSHSLRSASGTNIFSDARLRKDLITGENLSFYNESGSSTSKPLAQILDAGLTYQLNEENNFEFSGNYFTQNTSHNGISNISVVDNNGQYLSDMKSYSANDEYEKEGEGGISFEHLFNGNEDHNLTIEGTFAGYNESETQNFNELYTIPIGESTTKQILVKKYGTQTELVSEYALPIDNESDIEAGYSGEFIYDNIYYNSEDGENRFKFNQGLHALYGLYSRDISNFSTELGIRGELALIKSHLVTPTDLLTDNNYFKLYPSFLISYELDESQNFKLSYSKRINRPDADQLNPFPEYIDPRNAEAGNPNLRPEQIHSFELTYQKVFDIYTFTPTLFYRYKYDAFTTVSNLHGDSTIITTTENLSDQKNAGFEAIVSGKIEKWCNFDLSASLFYNQIDATNLGYSSNKSTISGMAELNSLFKATKKTFLQLNISYNSPGLTPQGQKEVIFYVNAGVKQLLYYDQISLTFTVSDLLSTYKERWNINVPDLNQTTRLYRKEPVFYLGFSWRFGESYQSDENKLEFEEEGLRKL